MTMQIPMALAGAAGFGALCAAGVWVKCWMRRGVLRRRGRDAREFRAALDRIPLNPGPVRPGQGV